MCARSRGSQHDAMLSGVTLRDRNDRRVCVIRRRVFMQNYSQTYFGMRFNIIEFVSLGPFDF